MNRGLVLALGAATIAAGALAIWQQRKDDYQRQAEEYITDKSGTIDIPADFDEKYFKDVIIARLNLAEEGNCAERRAAWQEFASYVSRTEILAEDRANTDLEKFGHQNFTNGTRARCIEEAYEKCAKLHDISQADVIQTWAMRDHANTGSQLPDKELQGGDVRVEQCLTFVLEVKAETDYGEWVPWGQAEIALSLQTKDAQTSSFFGQARMQAGIRIEPIDESCRATAVGVGAPFPMKVRDLRIERPKTRADSTASWKTDRIRFQLNPGTVTGAIQYRCADGNARPILEARGLYTGAFLNSLPKAIQEADGYWYDFDFRGTEIEGPKLEQEGMVARKVVFAEKDEVVLRVTMTLWHRPPWPVAAL